MRFTFGIISDGKSQDKVDNVIASILNQNIPKEDFEIIVVAGNKDFELPIINTRYISFDESIKPKWITKKKQIIAEQARFENLCLMHDYCCLGDLWYEGFIDFGEDYAACTNSLRYENGDRAIDNILIPHDLLPDSKLKKYIDEKVGFKTPNNFIRMPYDCLPNENTSEFYFLPGNFYCIKTEIAREIPLNTNKGWDEMEDIELSIDINKKYQLKFNPYSSCRFKDGGRKIGHADCPREIVEIIKQYKNE